MTSLDDRQRRPVRVNRIERLETRHMLSADGLSIDHFHDEFVEQLSQAFHTSQSLRGSEFDVRGTERSRTGRASEDQTIRPLCDELGHRNHTHDPSGIDGGRRERADQSLGREGRHYHSLNIARVANPPGGEGELVTNNNLLRPPPPAQFEPTTTTAPIDNARLAITSSRITFVIFLPSVSSSSPLDNGAGRSASIAPGEPRAAPQTTPADSPTADSRLPRSTEQVRTPAEQAAQQAEQADAVQLVSVRQRDDFFAVATAIDAVVEDRTTNAGASPRLNISLEALRFDDTPLAQWLEQSESLEDSFTELEELLDAIALERAESIQRRNNVPRPTIPVENHTDAIVESPSQQDCDGMILLLPAASLANPVAQVFDRLDDAAVSQWTVGVGFYRALEVIGDTQFADAFIASELAIEPFVSAAAEGQHAGTFTWQYDSSSSSHQAAGIVFCCLGIQYLRNRKQETDHTAVARRSVSRGEEMVD